MIKGHGLVAQLIRFTMSGSVVVISDFAAYALLLHIAPTAYLPANLCGKLTGAAIGFLLHKYFTFSWQKKAGTGQQLLSYMLLLLFNLASSSALLWLLVEWANANAYLAKLLVDMIVIATSFLAGRIWVYRAA